MNAQAASEDLLRHVVLLITLLIGYASLFAFITRRGWLKVAQPALNLSLDAEELAAWKQSSAQATTAQAGAELLAERIIAKRFPDELLLWLGGVKDKLLKAFAEHNLLSGQLPEEGALAAGLGSGSLNELGTTHAFRFSATLAETIFADESLGAGSFDERLCKFLQHKDARQRLQQICDSAGVPKAYRRDFIDTTIRLEAACAQEHN